MVWLYDSHIHLSVPFYLENLDLITIGMKYMKIKACCVSMDYSTSLKTLEISKNNDLIFPFVGIHPECINDDLQKMINLIETNHHSIIGIGEIGLDPTYTTNEQDYICQINVFEKLLSLAEKFKKPISIHSRKSLDKIFDIMTTYDTSRCLLHWFDGSKKQLKKAMDMGFFVSYGPVMLYANDKQSLLSETHREKILIETDGPVSFPRCFEFKNAQIGFLPSVAFTASKVLKISFSEFTSIIENNSKTYLNIK